MGTTFTSICCRNSVSVPLILATLKFLQHTEFLKVIWSVKGGIGERERETGREMVIEKEREREWHQSLASVYDCVKLLDSNTKRKGWSRQAVGAAP